MTQFDFWKAVANNEITDEVQSYAAKEAAKIEAKKAEKAAENADLTAKILDLFKSTEAPLTSSVVAEALDISVQKAAYLLKAIEGVTTEKVIKGSSVINVYNLSL